jgi:hypothetical protein
MVAVIRNTFLVCSLALPIMCIALPPGEVNALKSCERAEAQRLDVRVAATHDHLDDPVANLAYSDENSAQQMVVIARDLNGRVIAQMLCTFDKHGRVIDLHPASSVALALPLYGYGYQ